MSEQTTCPACGKRKVYSWQTKCYACQKKLHQIEVSQQIRSGEKGGADYEDDIYCPHCGVIVDIEDDYEWYEAGEHEAECPECGKKFTIETHVSHSFSTTAWEDQ